MGSFLWVITFVVAPVVSLIARVLFGQAAGTLTAVFFVVAILLRGTVSLATRVRHQPWMPLALLAVFAVAFAHPAFAQSVDVGGIYGSWKPYIVDIVGSLITAGVGWLISLA